MPKMDSDQFMHIYSLSRGHPLILELINRGNVDETFHATLEAFVEKEIFSRLSGSEKRVLGELRSSESQFLSKQSIKSREAST